jgi:hypothetical protein
MMAVEHISDAGQRKGSQGYLASGRQSSGTTPNSPLILGAPRDLRDNPTVCNGEHDRTARVECGYIAGGDNPVIYSRLL